MQLDKIEGKKIEGPLSIVEQIKIQQSRMEENKIVENGKMSSSKIKHRTAIQKGAQQKKME